MNRLLRSLHLLIALGYVVLPIAHGLCADPPGKEKAPPKPLAELAKDLRDPDLKKRLAAAEAIRNHYNGKAIDALPQIIEALGYESERPRRPNVGRIHLLEPTLRQAADCAGPDRLKVIREFAKHPDVRLRAGAFRAWLSSSAAMSGNVGWDELLRAARQGMSDSSPRIRRQVVWAMQVFQHAPAKVVEDAVVILTIALDDRTRPHEELDSPAERAVAVLFNFQAKAMPAIPALAKVAAVNDMRKYVTGTCEALNAIGKADPEAAEQVVSILRPLLNDEHRPDALRAAAVQGLIGIGPAVRWAVPDLADVLIEEQISEELRFATLHVLRHSGPRAVAALPALIKRLEQAVDRNEQSEILYIFREMGPAAAPAADAVEIWMDTLIKRDSRLWEEASMTLTVIRM